MNWKYLSTALLIAISMNAQDEMKMRYNATIKGEIVDEKPASLTYKKASNPDKIYTMDKGDVIEIKYRNGQVKTFDADLYASLTLEETKDALVKCINESGFVHEKDQRRFQARFQGDFLQITQLSDSGKPKESTTMSYDPAQVTSFMNVSARPNDIAYIDIWIMGTEGENTSKLSKKKMVVMTNPSYRAFEIYHMLKHLNKLLNTK